MSDIFPDPPEPQMPSEQEASRELAEESKRRNDSAKRFAAQQKYLGAVQLQAPKINL